MGTLRPSDDYSDEQFNQKYAWTWKRFVPALAIAAVYLFVGMALWVLLNYFYVKPDDIGDPADAAAAKKDLIQALGLIMAGLAGSMGIYFTWLSLRRSGENLQLTQEGLKQTYESTQKQQELARQGQITERFSRAIDQLGAVNDDGEKRTEVRLGAIHALGRLARDSEQDYWPIMQILTAYVREHAAWMPSEDSPSDDPRQKNYGEGLPESLRTRFVDSGDLIEDRVPYLAPDIEAIMTVVRECTRDYRDRPFGPTSNYINLSKTDLTQAYLAGAYLESANFERASLWHADFRTAHLRNANFWKATLRAADFGEAYLEEASFRAVDLRGADLDKAWLRAAVFRGAILWSAHLREANLQRADFERADLQEADLTGADLTAANLKAANLENVDLQEANLQEANLEEANLQGLTTSLTGANFTSANLKGVQLHNMILQRLDLRGANLQEVNLHGTSMEKVILQAATLENANLNLVDLDEADLTGANLKAASLRTASLRNAKLKGTQLEGADLQGANLSGADLSGASGLTEEQLQWVTGDNHTQLPEGLERPSQWMW